MNNAFKISTLLAQATPDMTINWEFQPSLQHLIKRSEDAAPDAPSWAETLPVPFDALHEPASFSEPLEGLSVRDIDEPEIFRVFFGPTEGAAARA